MRRRWILLAEGSRANPPGPDGVPRLVRRLLQGRGIRDHAEIERYLEPSLEQLNDPFEIPGLGEAVGRLGAAVERGEKIFLFGDYDVDGISSVAVWSRYLRQLGAEVREQVPNRLLDPYGLSIAAVTEAQRWGAGLIVCADSGTTAHEEVARATESGIDVIVADHHMPEPTLPEAAVIVNPWREDSSYPFQDLSAVGVTTKILQGLWRTRGRRLRSFPSPWSLLDLTALGTVADSVSMQGENRIFVSIGLRGMREGPRPALQSLIEGAGLDRHRLGSTDLAYQIVPRLNAGGRLGDAESALELLLCDDLSRCRRITTILDTHNERRKRLLEEVVRDAFQAAGSDPAPERGEPLVLCSKNWHPGVLGIAATRLAERFQVPTILLTTDGEVARGSGRTAGEWDLLDLVRRACAPLRTYGGHRAAIGLTLPAGNVARFRDEMIAASNAYPELLGRPERLLTIDATADLKEVDFSLLDWLERMEPFGRGNREPVLAVRGVVVGGIRVLREKHLRFDVADGGERRECIGFHLSERRAELAAADGDISLAVTATRNIFRGEERLQLNVRDIAVDDPFGNG
jgi:single-stranded-DNA-specific exonuclease